MTVRCIVFLFSVFGLFLFSSAAAAQEPLAIGCGMSATADGAKVSAGDPSICPEDVAFQMTYLLHQKVFTDPFFKALASVFVDEATLDSEFTRFAATQIGIAPAVFSLLLAVAFLSYAAISIVLTFKVVRYFDLIQRFARRESPDRGEAVKMFMYIVFLLLLSAPTPSGITLGQGVAVVSSLPAFMGGNYAYSTFLSATKTAAVDVNLNKTGLLPSSQVVANEFIEGEICQQRTRQALMNENAKVGSNFFSEGLTGYIWEEDQDDIVGRYSTCLSYSGVGKEGVLPGSLSSYQLAKTTTFEFYCPRPSFFAREIRYKPEMYGYNHVCTQIKYDMGENKFKPLIENGEAASGEDMDDDLVSIQSSFKAGEYYPKFKNAVSTQIKSILARDINEAERFKALKALFSESSSVFDNALSGNRLLSEGTNDERQIKYLAAQTALLGATIDMDGVDMLLDGMPQSLINTKVNRYYGTEEEKRNVFGVDHLLEDAREAARTMQRYQCALTWQSNTDTRMFITKFNQADSEDLESLFADRSGRLECVEFLAEKDRGSSDFDRYVRYPVLNPLANSDLVKDVNGVWIKATNNESVLTQTQQKMSGEIALAYYREMRYRQLVIAGYIAAVKESIGRNLSKHLSQELSERKQDYDLRSRGFGVMAGTMLYLSKHQNSAMHMGQSIEDAIQVSGGGQNKHFIDLAAFAPNDAKTAMDNLMKTFTEVPAGGLFMPGAGGTRDYPGPQGVSEEQEEQDALNNLIAYIESAFFAPMDHIKSASGMPADQSLYQGFQSCYNGGYSHCLSGQKHPLAAMSNMGNDLMNNMLQIMVWHAVVRTVNDMMFGLNSESGSIDGAQAPGGAKQKDKSLWSKLKDTAKEAFSNVSKSVVSLAKGAFAAVFVVLGAITFIAEIVLDMLKPFVLSMFVVGAVFAYMLPVTAFLYGLMMTIITVFTYTLIAFALPFYIVQKLASIEDSYRNGFKDFMEQFVGPYLKPLLLVVAITVSFSLISISLFVMNTVFAVLHSGLTPDGSADSATGVLASVMMGVMVYIVYFAALFVMFNAALKFIRSMPDMLVERMGFKRSGDEGIIGSLGFESYVGAQMMRTIGSLPQGALDKIVEMKRNGGFKRRGALRQEVEAMEALALDIEAVGGPAAYANLIEYAKNKRSGGGSPDASPQDTSRKPQAPSSKPDASGNESSNDA